MIKEEKKINRDKPLKSLKEDNMLFVDVIQVDGWYCDDSQDGDPTQQFAASIPEIVSIAIKDIYLVRGANHLRKLTDDRLVHSKIKTSQGDTFWSTMTKEDFIKNIENKDEF